MDVRLRPARLSDVDRLYRWRVEGEDNDWYEGRPVDEESHGDWFLARLNPWSLVKIWIGEWHSAYGWIPFGSCREDSNGELSYHVASEWQGRGFGTEMVKQAVEKSTNHRLKACVDHGNEGGAKVALAAGFEHRPDVDFYLLRR